MVDLYHVDSFNQDGDEVTWHPPSPILAKFVSSHMAVSIQILQIFLSIPNKLTNLEVQKVYIMIIKFLEIAFIS